MFSHLILVLLVLVVFVLDLLTPLGTAVWLLYVIPVYFSAVSRRSQTQYFITALCSVLVLLGLILSPPGIPYSLGFFNRVLCAAALWVVTGALIRRRRAVDARRELNDLMEGSLNEIYVFEADTLRFINVNYGARKNLGYSSAELSEMTPLDLKPEFDRARFNDLLKSLRSGQESKIVFETKHRRKDNSLYDVEVHVHMANYERRPVFVAMILDVSDRKMAEERLNLSEKKFSDAFHTSPAGIIITRIEDGRFIDVNDAFLLMFEFSREEVIGHTSIELNILTPKERARLIGAQIESGGLRNAELPARSKSGKSLTVLFSSKPIEWEGETQHITTLIDITDRKRAEEALREREDQYRDLVDNMRDLVCTHDLQGRLLFVNRASAELLGYAPHELLGKNLREILDDQNPHLFDDYLKTIETVREASGLMMVRTRSGEARIWEYHNTLRSEGIEDPTVRGLARDITDRKRAEDALRASRDQLRALSGRLLEVREEEGTRIAREIHDELGGALTGFKWDLEELERNLVGLNNGEGLGAARARIPILAGNMDSTIDVVRRISSDLRPGVLDDLGLVAAIEWQAQQFQRRTGLMAQCESCGDVDLPRERAIAIFRAFQEMLTNVLRHARATGVEIVMAHDGHEFVLEVRDDGCGITGAELADTKSLGLLGMRERIQLIDGRIEISGVKEKGTKVVVRVPLR